MVIARTPTHLLQSHVFWVTKGWILPQTTANGLGTSYNQSRVFPTARCHS